MTGALAPRTSAARYVVDATLRAPRRQAASEAAPSSTVAWARRYRRRLLLTDSLVTSGVSLGALFISGFNPTYFPFTTLLVVLWSFALMANRSRNSRIVGAGPEEYKRVLSASIVTFGALAIAILLMQTTGLQSFFFYSLPAGTMALIVTRWLWRQWLIGQRRHGRYLSRALVVGSREDVIEITRRIESSAEAAYSVVGAVGRQADTLIDLGSRHIPVVGGPDRVASAVRAVGADAVIVTGSYSGDQEYVRSLSWSLEDTSAEMVLSSGLTDVAGPRIHMRPVEGLPLMHVELPTFDGGKHLIKRSFDVTLSGIALVLLAPVMIVIAALVKADSAGPVLFRQERVGKDGRTFHMLKFRSMVRTAEQDLSRLLDQNQGAGPLFKLHDDPRVTRLGRVLRKHSLDELPQLWNILVGDMSIVGPRPPLPHEVSAYEHHVNRRLYIKPGLTGLWQISGRSDLSWEESIRLDLYYVENWSLAGDLVIMWRTGKVLLNRDGAY